MVFWDLRNNRNPDQVLAAHSGTGTSLSLNASNIKDFLLHINATKLGNTSVWLPEVCKYYHFIYLCHLNEQ